MRKLHMDLNCSRSIVLSLGWVLEPRFREIPRCLRSLLCQFKHVSLSVQNDAITLKLIHLNGFPLLTGIQFFPVLHASVSRVLKPETLPAFCRVKTDLTCVALKALTDPSTAQKKFDMLFMRQVKHL